jgi:hypothetical protein
MSVINNILYICDIKKASRKIFSGGCARSFVIRIVLMSGVYIYLFITICIIEENLG